MERNKFETRDLESKVIDLLTEIRGLVMQYRPELIDDVCLIVSRQSVWFFATDSDVDCFIDVEEDE